MFPNARQPLQITHAAPGPNVGSQSVSFAQPMQSPFNRAPQKLAFPVVRKQNVEGSVPHGASSARQESSLAWHVPTSCALHSLLSFLPFLAPFPLQTPEQHFEFFPLHFLPTLRQPNSFFFGLLRFLFFFWLATRPEDRVPARTLPMPAIRPPKAPRRVGAMASERVRWSKLWLFTSDPLSPCEFGSAPHRYAGHGNRQTLFALGPQQLLESVLTQNAPAPNGAQSALVSH